jgi:hypothetical protein
MGLRVSLTSVSESLDKVETLSVERFKLRQSWRKDLGRKNKKAKSNDKQIEIHGERHHAVNKRVFDAGRFMVTNHPQT